MADGVVYKCARCGCFIIPDSPEAQSEADAEATLLFGVVEASTDPSMGIVCHQCFVDVMKPGQA